MLWLISNIINGKRQFWGGGTLSSSDGQRFPVAVHNREAVALPRYFGYGKGLTFYTWTSDQHSQYGDKVIPSTMKDASYLLDAILDNETELSIPAFLTKSAIANPRSLTE